MQVGSIYFSEDLSVVIISLKIKAVMLLLLFLVG
jgi:hypothetical protein